MSLSSTRSRRIVTPHLPRHSTRNRPPWHGRESKQPSRNQMAGPEQGPAMTSTREIGGRSGSSRTRPWIGGTRAAPRRQSRRRPGIGGLDARYRTVAWCTLLLAGVFGANHRPTGGARLPGLGAESAIRQIQGKRPSLQSRVAPPHHSHQCVSGSRAGAYWLLSERPANRPCGDVRRCFAETSEPSMARPPDTMLTAGKIESCITSKV